MGKSRGKNKTKQNKKCINGDEEKSNLIEIE